VRHRRWSAMAGALRVGWDQPSNPRGAERTIERYKWKPQAETQQDTRQQHGPASGAVGGATESTWDDDDNIRPCQEILLDCCRACCSTVLKLVGEFCAGWFGAVHLQHFSADDMELDLPKSAAARELREQALKASMTGSVWTNNFKRLNPKITAHPKGWSGAHRVQHGWAGDPNPRPESANYWKHTWGLTEDEPMVTRQYLPVFVVLQSLVCMVLWVIFSLRDGTDLGGLESIWPEQTDLCLQWDCVDYRSEAWRWWTYQFTHIGIAHVAGNCVMTLFFGINLEGVHGWWRMFLMFNIGVFGGSCCCFVADPHTRVVGMSGGCYALVGMHFGDVLMNFNEQRRAAEHFANLPSEQKKNLENIWRKMIIAPRQKIAVLLLLVTIDLVQGYLTRGSGVSLSAHFGGFVAGFLICIVLGHNMVVKGHERCFWVCAVLAGTGCILFCMLWGMSWPPRDIFDPTPWCWGRQIANVSVFGDNTWHCVRCPDDACIRRWHIQAYIETVTDRTCQSNGGWDVTDG